MSARCNECGNPVDFHGMLCEVCCPETRDIAQLGREEHEMRENFRQKKKRQRGFKKSQQSPRSLRAKRSADKANPSTALPSSDLTEERTRDA